MGIFDSFTGASQKRYAREGYEASTRQLQQGYDEGRGEMEKYYGQGQGYLTPYATQGQGASKLYNTYMGLEGADAQRSALANYAGGDPFRQHNEDMGTRAVARRYNQMGMGNSGNMAYAMSRASLDRGSQDYENYMNRLSGLGQQGYGASGQLAGYANQMGNNLGQMRFGLGQQQAGNEIQYRNAMSQADGILTNNLMKLGGLAISGFTGMPMGMGGGSGGTGPTGGSGGMNYFGGPF